MNEMSAGAVQITNAVEEVASLSEKNRESIELLSVTISKFKV
ncbi:MAG: hypothetical protein ACTTIZ_06455 [Treponema sp.]